jgi:hypothetical protein
MSNYEMCHSLSGSFCFIQAISPVGAPCAIASVSSSSLLLMDLWPSAHIAIEFVKQYTLHRYLACHAPYARCYPITPNKAFHYGP